MKKILLTTTVMLACLTASAQSALDTDFETGEMPTGWTVAVPESPYKGGYSVVKYADQSALKTTNVGSNDLGGTYVLLSKTGATNSVKGNSDNWLISPQVTIGTDNVFSFRLAANCSYSPTKGDAEKMKMDVLAICGADTIKLATITPENYFTWKQYSLDLSAFNGKSVKVAFHDYGTTGSGAIADMKYIDNIKLTSLQSSDYVMEAMTTLYGQAQLTAPFTVKISNYGISKGTFSVKYEYGDVSNTETIESNIANGESMEYTFKKAPSFAYGDSVIFKAYVVGADDAMSANDSIVPQTIAMSKTQSLPFSAINVLDDDDTDNDDLVQPVFSFYKGSSYAKWSYDAVKYNAWIYSQTKNDDKYVGVSYLYTNSAFTLPAGKVNMTTIGTATLTDMMYEVYIAKYGAKDMATYGTKVGETAIMRDVPNTGGGIDTTTVELNILEAGDYIIGIRPITHLTNSQMTIIGFSIMSAELPEDAGVKELIAQPTTHATEIYNLAGQRVTATRKGLQIVNGKKFMRH